MHDHQRVAVTLRPQHLNLAADDDEDGYGAVAHLHEHVAIGHRAAAAVRRHPRHLGCGQRGKQMLGKGRDRALHRQRPNGRYRESIPPRAFSGRGHQSTP